MKVRQIVINVLVVFICGANDILFNMASSAMVEDEVGIKIATWV